MCVDEGMKSLTLLVFAASLMLVAAAPPNLVVVHTDEHNFRTLGCYRKVLPEEQGAIWGAKAVCETPHIDALAEGGVQFASAFVTSSLCSPSRASFFTGQYMHHHKVVNNSR